MTGAPRISSSALHQPQPATGFDLDHRCGFGSPAFSRIAS